jgi:hypothetical protein
MFLVISGLLVFAIYAIKSLWVLINSSGKVSCRRIRDLDSNPTYIKNQLVSNGKEQLLWSGCYKFKFYHFYKK